MTHTYSQLFYHLVWSTKGRTKSIKGDFRGRLYAYFAKIISAQKGIALAIGGIADHVHLLVNVPASVSIPELVRQMKHGSSQWITNERLYPCRFCWQEGYGVFSVSASSVEAVKAYIENQEAHHQVASFEQEYAALLSKHGVTFDERFVFG